MKIFIKEKVKIMVAVLFIIAAAIMHTEFVLANVNSASLPEIKNITVYDGEVRTVVKTRGNTFKDVLDSLSQPLRMHDTYWTSTEKLKDGAVLYVERSVPVTIIENDKEKIIYTTQQTVQGAVNDAGYDWRKMMPLEDGLSKVHENMKIHMVPYTARNVVREESVPAGYTMWYDSSLAPDEVVVIQEGTPERRRLEIEEFISDGKVIHESVFKVETLEAGVKGIARTGKRDGAVGWVTTMNATAYHPNDGGGDGITATGTKAGYGTVAVDPSVIPLGSKLYIPQYGEAIAADTGGAIVGHKIDLCMESYEECYQFGRRDVQVFINY